MTRTTTHAGNGTARHNFREFPTTAKGKSDIDRELSHSNKFFVSGKFFDNELELKNFYQSQKKFFSNLQNKFKGDNRFKELSNTEKIELAFYEKYFSDTINKQHIRNEQRGQQCLNRSSLDMFLSKKTQPEETIFQIGNKDYCPVTADQLWDIYKDYQKKHNQIFGRNIKIIDAVLHVDETTIHTHERKLYLGLNSHNEVCPSKDSALEQLGIERPNTNKPTSRYNNRKQTYTKQCRKLWIEVCQQHGLNIETEPQVYKDKKGLELTEYKVSQEQKKLDDIQQQLTKADNQLKEKVYNLKGYNELLQNKTNLIKKAGTDLQNATQKVTEQQELLESLKSETQYIQECVELRQYLEENETDFMNWYFGNEQQIYQTDEEPSL